MTSPNTPSSDAVRAQLARLETSEEFASSGRLLAFLRFIVNETLDGRGAGLKEVVIGNAIYGRDQPYDARIDSTVRVEARRLRRKLQAYYTGAGRNDPTIVELPLGGYIPTFADNDGNHVAPHVSEPQENIFRSGRGASIAIMPFRAIPRDPHVESFADGLTDEVIFAMDSGSGTRIVSRSTVFQYKDVNCSVAELSRLLSVDAVLQGVVRREGDMLRVTVEVSDTDGFMVWSDRFDGPDAEPLQLQEKIARTLLSRARLDSSKMRDMMIGPGPVALQANAKIYRARLLLDQQTPRSIEEAKRLFLQVAASAPDYARGHSGIADCHCDLFRLGLIDRDQALKQALPAAQAALTIDAASVEAHTALATIFAWMERDPARAEAEFERTRRLGTSARANRLYGVFLSLFGEHDKALRLFREARDVEPFSAQQDIAEAMSHYQARRDELILAGNERHYMQRYPGEALVFHALTRAFAGNAAVVEPMIADIERQCGEHPDYVFIAAELAAWLGDASRARKLNVDQNARASCFAKATLYASIGDAKQACAALSRALDRGELSTAWMRSDRRFDGLRDSADFQQQLQRLRPLHLHVAN